MGLFSRWGGSAGRDARTRAAARRLRPQCDRLEPREMPVITSVTGSALPSILQPPDGRTVAVRFRGTVSNNIQERPSVTFRVIDEYRLLDQVATVNLTPNTARTTPGNYVYNYAFRINLPAQVSSSDTSGRSYYVLISAGDSQNGQGKYIPLWVPLNPVPIKGKTRAK